MMVPARRAAPRFTSYRPRRGLGLMSYYDLMAQADLRSCDPFDSACVARNTARQAAVEDFWVGHNMTVPDGTVLDFGELSAGQVQQFRQNVTPSVPMTVQMPEPVQVAAPVPTAVTVSSAAPQSTTTTPDGKTITQASAVPESLALPVIGGFDLSQVPLWGWGVGAVVLLFALGGLRGGR